MSPDPLRLQIVGAAPLMQAGLIALLGPYSDRVLLLGETEPAEKADVVLVDLGQDRPVQKTVEEAVARGVAVVALLPVADDQGALLAKASGAAGSVWYSAGVDEVMEALTRAAAGEHLEHPPTTDWRPVGLSEREAEVLSLVACGMSNQEICQHLYLSINTVKTYVRTSYRKIGATRRSQAVAWSIRHGLALRGSTRTGREPGMG